MKDECGMMNEKQETRNESGAPSAEKDATCAAYKTINSSF
jgi:hypothetical protein